MGDWNLNDYKYREKIVFPYYKYYAHSIVLMTIILTILRIIFYFFEIPFFTIFRDIDLITLRDWTNNGLVNYYSSSSIRGFRAIYLYYWNFIYYPIYIIPLEIGVYIWDAFRLITAIYIAKNVYQLSQNHVGIVFYFILSGLGYFIDGYLNNTNWLIQLLLFESFLALKKEKKILAGLLFTLACYKIIVIAFPFVLLITKKIKIKDLIYYFLPLIIICIPYFIFPDYLMQMLNNWFWIEGKDASNEPLMLQIYLLFWQGFQTAQLLFVSLIMLMFLGTIKEYKWRVRFRLTIFISLIILTFTFPIVLWQFS
ncbi:MAG: hypothetical protein ACTSRI_15685 [Promethearchaeota archaeon]